MISQRLHSIKQIKTYWVAPAMVMATLGFAGLATPAIASAQSSSAKTASCSITGVPATVTNGEAITPTVTVTNNGTSTFTSTVTTIEELVQKGGGKGGAGENTVTVTPGQSVQFQGGTVFAETGYKVKIVSKSIGKPHFRCKSIVAKID